jgi:hypothetical protein
MDLDDPKLPEFMSWDSYQLFAKRVRNRRRYVFDKEISAFLETVIATTKNRDVDIAKGSFFFRAQKGIEYRPVYDEEGHEAGEEPCGYDELRMSPQTDRAVEGRINPAGIPMLYQQCRQRFQR